MRLLATLLVLTCIRIDAVDHKRTPPTTKLTCETLDAFVWDNAPRPTVSPYTSLFVEYMRCVSRDSSQLVVQFEQEGSGWGNQMRGYIWATHMSILLKRPLILAHPLLAKYFASPDETIVTQLSAPQLQAAVKRTQTAEQGDDTIWNIDVNDYPDSFGNVRYKCSILDNRLEDKRLEDGQHWQHNKSIRVYQAASSDPMWSELPAYRDVLFRLFGTRSRYSRASQILSFLLSKPRAFYLDAVRATQKRLRWPSAPSKVVAVQYRFFVDSKNQQHLPKAAFAAWLSCVVKHIQQQFENGHLVRNYTAFLPMSDSTSGATQIADALTKAFPSSLAMSDPTRNFQHTAQEDTKTQNASSPMIEWFLLGESDLVYHGATTFGIAAVERTSFVRPHLRVWSDRNGICPQTYHPRQDVSSSCDEF